MRDNASGNFHHLKQFPSDNIGGIRLVEPSGGLSHGLALVTIIEQRLQNRPQFGGIFLTILEVVY